MSGYKIIDLNNINLTNGNIEYDNTELLKEIENTYQNKSYLIDNINIDNVERKALFTELIPIDNGYKMSIYDKDILINENGYRVDDIANIESVQEDLNTLKNTIQTNTDNINTLNTQADYFLPAKITYPRMKTVQEILTFYSNYPTTFEILSYQSSDTKTITGNFHAIVEQTKDVDNSKLLLNFSNDMYLQHNDIELNGPSLIFVNRDLYTGYVLDYELPYNHIVIGTTNDDYSLLDTAYYKININYCDTNQDLLNTYIDYESVAFGNADVLPLDINKVNIIIKDLDSFNKNYRLCLIMRVINPNLIELTINILPISVL